MTFTMNPTLFRILMVVFVVALLGIFFAVGKLFVDTYLATPEVTNDPIPWGEAVVDGRNHQATFDDSVLETKVEQTVVSANIQGGRMGSYDGVCKDITVVAPIRCHQEEFGYAIYAPMADGSYFCVDSSEFRGYIQGRPQQGSLCATVSQ
jgi:hypothetical protein